MGLIKFINSQLDKAVDITPKMIKQKKKQWKDKKKEWLDKRDAEAQKFHKEAVIEIEEQRQRDVKTKERIAKAKEIENEERNTYFKSTHSDDYLYSAQCSSSPPLTCCNGFPYSTYSYAGNKKLAVVDQFVLFVNSLEGKVSVHPFDDTIAVFNKSNNVLVVQIYQITNNLGLMIKVRKHLIGQLSSDRIIE